MWRGGPLVHEDTRLLLRNVENAGEHDHLLFILRSHGTAYSNQVREFLLTDDGIQLKDVYIGPGTVPTGSAWAAQEARDGAQVAGEQQATARMRRADMRQG